MICLRGEQILLFMELWSWSGMHQLARQDEIVLLTKVDNLYKMTKLSPKNAVKKNKNKNEQWALNVCGATKEARCRIPWDRGAAQAAAK